MMRSMFAGVSGLRSHQTMTDVIANNIANVNTIGFKAARVQFADTLSQQLRGASGGTGEATAGINPQQVGLGVKVVSTNISFSQGGMQLTGRATDIAIQGDGFFITNASGRNYYTRAGSFSFDDSGYMTDPAGGVVMGWNADPTTNLINTNSPLSAVQVPVNATIPPVPTGTITLRGNLPSDAAVGHIQPSAIDIIDNLGTSHRISFEWEKTGDNAWSMRVLDPDDTVISTVALTFDPSTGLVATPSADPTISYTPPGSSAVPMTLDLGFGNGTDALTQFGEAADAAAVAQNGNEIGYLRSFAMSDDGKLSGVFSNGETKELAQIGLATFSNPSGLLAAGDTRYLATTASGQAVLGTPGTAGRGSVAAGTLEMANVDLSEEFTQLIVAQRGFQANSRTITTSDEMIQELVNLKR